jgi:polar amino acid transport system substrate-binding protein/cystine transport system substrate-binding protein/membrane-bound lytic murein transglycosylase F
MNRAGRSLGDIVGLVAILALLAAVSFLPADTSLAEIRRSGIMRACVPEAYPPLVTGRADQPGVDIELLRLVAERLGVALRLNVVSAMGRDFDPRNWGVTRAQCSILAGGVVASATTRSFLETTPPYLETGWAAVAPEKITSLKGDRVGVRVGLSGLDRIGLSSFIRDEGATLTLAASSAELVAGLRTGSFQAGVTEALSARQIAGEQGWSVVWLPESLGRYPIGFGLWKGDLTFKRAVATALGELEAEGQFQAIIDRYKIAPIEGTLPHE